MEVSEIMVVPPVIIQVIGGHSETRGWIAGVNPFCQLIEIRTLGYPGILGTGSCSPLTGINIPNIFKDCIFFLNLVGQMTFFFPFTLSYWLSGLGVCQPFI
jgi:hypothetical protein